MEGDLGKVARAILNSPDAVAPSVLAGQYDEEGVLGPYPRSLH